jgi:hypothetical protein
VSLRAPDGTLLRVPLARVDARARAELRSLGSGSKLPVDLLATLLDASGHPADLPPPR